MLKTLLIGTNGSQWSQTAVDLGLAWGSERGIPVTFLGIVDIEGVTHGEPIPIGAAAFKLERDTRLLAETRDRIERALAEAEARAAELGVTASSKLVEGDPAEQLAIEVQRHDLLLIGKRAVPHTDHDPAASRTLTSILQHAPRPVVVAGDVVPEASSIVVAYDGSRQAARTLASFVATGLYADRETRVIGVGDDPGVIEPKVRLALDFMAAHGRSAHAQILPIEGGVAHTLVQASTLLQAGVLVMGAYGQPRIKEMLFGSVTRSLLARVPVPLFLDH
jgi:nucleotide-binding universal stress UspA family protein